MTMIELEKTPARIQVIDRAVALLDAIARYPHPVSLKVLGAETDTSKIRKIQKTMRRFPSLPAYYVGDTKGDMIEGRSAGAKTVAVSWGWHPEEKLREGRPDFMIRSLIELATLLGCSSHTKSRYQMQAISNYQ